MDLIHLDPLLHLFFLTNHYNSLQLNPRDVYKAEIYVLIYDLYNLGMIIDVCLQLLIDELNQLWSVEEFTYDISRKQESIAFQEIIMVVNCLRKKICQYFAILDDHF